ncbi:MAG: selenium-dependent molybdenum cofactor biosynthesis protein YqeB [bacterium]|nr:selenium-dependent molybdenum cofactor biosynthesis protein YqeB [bacterium]MDO5575417.1 selenium-dependent molybdenum cofactor biosynthesis protein YqeB [bacterium]
MKVLIKGAGDLATGIACRLRNSGYDILMTDIAEPTTVRRTVAFSRAVYEGRCEIEGIEGVLVPSDQCRQECLLECERDQASEWLRDTAGQILQEIESIQAAGKVAVMVDEKAEIAALYQPEVIVDAILAKKNLGTRMTDAPLVIGVGPGFTAEQDVHAVIETKRGHDLGRVIRKGSAIPNTGIPGDVGGYTIERLIKAAADGAIHPLVNIGDKVSEGQPVAEVITEDAEEPAVTYALMSGIVRGMLQEGVSVTKGMKIGDIDARCEIRHCYSVSDKARAIGGGVLEALAAYEHE